MSAIEHLLEIMARLRDPETGCPWDRKQTFQSLIPHTLEEAYEVADAIERGDYDDLCDELGDLLLQVVFYARIAQEQGLFDFAQIVNRLCDKLVRRHPHVFSGVQFASEKERRQAWEASKRAEREAKGKTEEDPSLLADIPATLPALLQAEKIQNRAARHGFDWPEVNPVFSKVEEELAELREAVTEGDDQHIQEEVGDLLFVVVNLARHLGVHPETALRESNRKFGRRFRFMEQRLAKSGQTMAETPLADLDALWDEAKQSGQT
ncbi:MAG: nucleoside triphosphate hydrolase [Methylothermaceae bacteria B42]|nr:MAG: nucleoside triphosphate hydrolase [Methylothermaceae bacteria B42]HHJ39556.1 nucleoside triphosphate pyrophosphohydrolase [Methylothermaceae bacterium]